MREIEFDTVVNAVKDLIIHCSTDLPEDMYNALKESVETEKSPVAKAVLEQILENAHIAKTEERPLCQDTGLAVFFIKVGEEVRIKGGLLKDAINMGTERGYKEGYLRASTCHPFTRANLKDEIGYNLPAIIHTSLPATRSRSNTPPKGAEARTSPAPGSSRPPQAKKGSLST